MRTLIVSPTLPHVNSKRSVNKMATDSTSDVALDCELEVLPLEGSKSDVWQYFSFPAIEGKFPEPDKKKFFVES